jgi:RimJ/RimL family protein N-acetyltransferase
MLIRASFDEKLCFETYLPHKLSEIGTSKWLESRPVLSWCLVLDREPIGWYELSKPKGEIDLETPPGSLEREVWLLEKYRGLRLIQRATDLIIPFAKNHGVHNLLGIVYEDNHSARRGLEAGGFKELGKTMWRGENNESGWAWAYILNI